MIKLLEIACFNYESAIIAAKAGADRIEFCSEFSTGGATPDLKETEKLIKNVSIPVFVMIRPSGGSNFMNETQIQNSISEIRNFIDIGVSGFVFGIIESSLSTSFDTSSKNRTTQDDRYPNLETSSVTLSRSESSNFVSKGQSLILNKSFNQKLIHAANGLHCTFHRAFDHTENLFESLEEIIDCGFTRILCSGGKGNAIDNIETLKKLNETSKGRITIMPGGGVRSSNIEKLLETGCTEFHSSGILRGEVADESEIRKLKSLFSK